jgi:hypothetical protein
MPGYRVLGFDCNSIIPQFGAIHCITKEVGVREPVHIAHARLWDAADTSQSHTIEATITARSGIDSAFLFWRADTTMPFTRLTMLVSGGTFTADIPQQTGGTRVAYYIEALTGSGRRVTKPIVGSSGAYVFDVNTITTVAGFVGPRTFTLAQNFPNPFNPTTSITFTLPSREIVSLSVFDMLGQEVKTLLHGELDPGGHTVTFDATGVASGVYFYRLHAGSFVQTKRMVLLR